MNKLLVIDDEKAICSSLEFALEDEYEVMTVTGPAEALAVLAQVDIQLVLLDLKLGEHNGLDLLRRIKSEYKDLPVIIMTAYGTIKTTVEAIKEGAYYYLVKPINIEELKILLEKALEFGRLHSEVRYLNREIKQRYNLGNIIGKSQGMKKVYELIERVKDIDSNPMCLSPGKAGPVRNWWPKPSIILATGRNSIWRLSTAPQFRPIYWKANFLVMKRGPSPAPPLKR